MKKYPFLTSSVTPLTRLAIGVGAFTVFGIASGLLPQATLAQSTEAQPLRDFQASPSEPNSLSGTLGGGSVSVFDMIHNLRLGGQRSSNEFIIEQRQNIDNSATEYLRLRQERLRNLQTPSTGNSPLKFPAE